MMKKTNNILIYKQLLSYVKPYWPIVIVMIVATGVYSYTSAIYASKFKIIIDEGFIEKNMSAIYTTIAVLIIVTIFRGVSFFISNYTMRRVSSDVVFNLRKEMFGKLQTLHSKYFDRVNTGEILSRFNYDVLQVTDAATNVVITLVREGTLVLALLGYLFYQNWKLTLIIFILAPIIATVITIISKRLRTLAEGIQCNMSDMNHVLDESIKGHKIIKIFGGQKAENEKFTKSIRHIRNASIKSEVASSLGSPVIEMLIVALISIVIWLMAREAKFGILTPGDFLSYTIMVALLPSPIKKLMRINENIQRGLAASKSIFSFLDENIEKNNIIIPQGHSKIKFNGEIKFHNVNFSYAKKSILSDINLHINIGETIALVGASGSGKSSLVSLIPRFYEVDKGQITLDNIDISEIDLISLRKHIAFVSQDIILFDDTIINNIAYGQEKKDIDIRRIKESAKMAYADDFILKMDNGYDSNIGEAGQLLSGGQRQRLAIARAIYKNAPVIILDEATSALDRESENKVQLALNGLLKDKTSIIIAHRLSTVKNADRIAVLDQGKIVEQGTHKELIANKSRYYHLNESLI